MRHLAISHQSILPLEYVGFCPAAPLASSLPSTSRHQSSSNMNYMAHVSHLAPHRNHKYLSANHQQCDLQHPTRSEEISTLGPRPMPSPWPEKWQTNALHPTPSNTRDLIPIFDTSYFRVQCRVQMLPTASRKSRKTGNFVTRRAIKKTHINPYTQGLSGLFSRYCLFSRGAREGTRTPTPCGGRT